MDESKQFALASELIVHLQDLIQEHGDKPVALFDIEGDPCAADVVRYVPSSDWFYLSFRYQEDPQYREQLNDAARRQIVEARMS